MNRSIDNLIAIGEIVKTRGVRGEVKAIIYSGLFDDLLSQTEITVLDSNNTLLDLDIKKTRLHKKALLIQFSDYNSIEEAQELVGGKLMIDKAALEDLPEGEYYWFELIGMKVSDKNGNYYGQIKKILETGSNDVYISEDNEKEYLIPATKEVVLEVNKEKQTILIDPQEGLFDND